MAATSASSVNTKNRQDGYLNFANSGFGKKLFGVLGLPVPPVLKRANQNMPHELAGAALLGCASGKQLSPGVIDAIEGMEQLSITGLEGTQKFSAEQLNQRKLQALVFDATGIQNSENLKDLYQFFHQSLRSLDRCGRVVVIGYTPEKLRDARQATAQRALQGFVKSVAKEVGRKGGTANLLYLSETVSNELASSLRFFLSHRSAYVDGQVVRISSQDISLSPWAKPLQGKVALVTGASRGIGAAIAQVLARDGATVVGLDVPQSEDELKKGMDAIGGEALSLNITDSKAPETLQKYFTDNQNGLDIVVHNAGVTRDKTLSRMTEMQWDLLLDINLSSIERINQTLLEQHVLNEGGRIIGVSSISGIAGNLGQSNYAASKAGVIGLVDSHVECLRERNITINAVAPGFIETKMTAAIPFMTRQLGRRLCSLSQGGLPVDVAETIAFFAAPQSQGVSGNTVRVCGQNIMGA